MILDIFYFILEHVVNYNSNEETASVSTVDGSQASSNSGTKLKFIDTLNPLLSFSNDDLAAMNEDVDEIYESDSSDDDPVDIGKFFCFLRES